VRYHGGGDVIVSTHRTAGELRTVGRPFTPGHDPRRNEGGRPALPGGIKEAFKALLPRSVEVLAELLGTVEEPYRDARLALEAAQTVQHRVLGRPVDSTTIDATEGMEPPKIIIQTLPIGERGEPGAQ